ncbi:hypothetical protein FRX31_004847, partial [Thalictrum thalictroides]
MGILLHKFHPFQNQSSGGVSLKRRVNILGRNLDNYTWLVSLKVQHYLIQMASREHLWEWVASR